MEKDKYTSIFIAVRDIIKKLDPIGLLKQGAPEDEYDGEIQKIISGLRNCNDVGEVQELTYNIFKESFGEDTAGERNLYLEAAEEIFEQKAKGSDPKI